MATFTIPTIFSAIDKLTAPVRKMTNSVQDFATRADGAIGRNERLFKKLTPALSEASKQFLHLVSAATLVAAVVGGITFSVKSIKDYEKAVASFRVIVGGTDYAFKKYQDKINEVAADTKRSSIDTAMAFEKIAGLNAKFADTADHIGMVSKAAITLSKASGEELGPSAESLVGIMNQFSLAADQADRTINVLAAGTNVGASSIAQTAEAFTTFGAVASSANVTLEETTGLIQTMAKFSVFGSEAGNQLKGTLVHLQKTGMGYKNGVFNINEALEEMKAKVDKLRTAKEKDAYITKTFGLINLSTGKTLLNNIDLFKEFTKGVTDNHVALGTAGAAQDAAAIRTNTLSNAIEELKAAWINMLTGSSRTSAALEKVKSAIQFVTENLDTLLMVAGSVVAAFLAWKTVLVISKAAMFAYNVVLGVMNALDTTSVMLKSENTIAQAAYLITTKAMTAGLWLAEAAQAALNVVMNLNPIGILIVSVTALSLAVGSLVRYYNSANTAAQLQSELSQRVHDKTIDQRVEITQLFMALRKAEAGSVEYAEVLNDINKIQPGVIDKYNLQRKSLEGIAAAEREVTKTIMKRAEAEAKAEMLKEAIKEKITLQTQGLSGFEKFSATVGGLNQEKIVQAKVNEQDKRIALLTQSMKGDQPKELVTPTSDNQKTITNSLLEKTNNAKLEINVNDPNGRTTTETKSSGMKIKTTSTMKYNS